LTKKILITGASGMLGKCVVNELVGNSHYAVFSVGRSAASHNQLICDLSDIASFKALLESLRPSLVVHCAANVNLNSCESDKDYTYRLHVQTGRVISKCTFIERSLYISTDSVFNGNTGNYTEEDFIDPLNYYALTKALGEEAFLNSCHSSLVLRNNIFGFKDPPGNSIFEWAWKNLQAGKQIQGYSNVFFNPLYVGTLAKIIVTLLESEITGLLNLGCREGLSKYDFIRKIAALGGYPSSLVQEARMEENGTVKRPLNTILSVERATSIPGLNLPDIETDLNLLYTHFKRNLYDQRF